MKRERMMTYGEALNYSGHYEWRPWKWWQYALLLGWFVFWLSVCVQ